MKNFSFLTLVAKENFASAKYNAETICGGNASVLLRGNFTDYDLNEGNLDFYSKYSTQR